MKRMVVALSVILLCVLPCHAATYPEMDELWDQAENYGIMEGESLEEGIGSLLSQASGELGGVFRQSTATALKLTAVVLLCALAEGAKGEDDGLRVVEIAGALAITALTMTDMDGMLGLGRETIGEMGAFSKALLPVMAVLTAATGSPAGAAVRQGATVLFSQLLLTVMDSLLVPLVYSYVAVCCASAAIGTPGLDKLAGLLKSAVTFVLTALLLAFVGYLTASGAIAGSADASAVKAARMAITRAIPVVGGILADASETVLAGASSLRGVVGAAGMLVVLTICLAPFLHLAVHYLTYKVTAALCALVARPALSRLIDAIGSAFGLVLGMTGAAALILLISLVSALSAVIP